ncbi:N-acetyl-gamma-glutamyl-phosphate reductase [Dehalogenimonas alkenigignens]|uniref:N-acetyl-gamma-glutamyl-phosphate reductase n=1 Tax=Dehalogenimonas alkenigignens TaxID=1217799 RepID=UPI0007308795|nr:N-acetyl-gamma-glutamyl-phosphate reductase [Dehalogenimonas alkenigignens]
MSRTRVGILNVTGYAGAELARLLADHPLVDLVSVTGRSAAGQKLGQVFPHLAPLDLAIEAELGQVDFIFSALPHHESAERLLPFIEKGVPAVDLSADFRLKDAALYDEWYAFRHPAPQLLADAVYGLPELNRAEIQSARLVANPGCYPTASILALAPALKAGIVTGGIIVDAKSGISGAGRALKLASHFCEADEDVCAYAIAAHRHQPEIFQALKAIDGAMPALTFTPHLTPMTRGILATCYARLNGELTAEEAVRLYAGFYAGEPFVRVVPEPPHTKHASGSNACLVNAAVDRRAGMLIVTAAIDNLVKGAAGQAIQNMNLMLGYPETTGLPRLARFP